MKCHGKHQESYMQRGAQEGFAEETLPLRPARIPGGATVASFTQGAQGATRFTASSPRGSDSANFHRLLTPGPQGVLGRASRAFGEQWDLFQTRGSQAASLPWRPFREGLWEVSLLPASGPVKTAKALLSVGRRCRMFRWPQLGLCLQKA